MTYEYYCEKCKKFFDVVKSVKDMDVNEFCPTCQDPSIRQFTPKHLYLSQTSVEDAGYNPGLGCVIKNKKQKEELLKKKGLVEVGNDFSSGEKMMIHFDTSREEKRSKRYEDV